jgi:hypothetical protein
MIVDLKKHSSCVRASFNIGHKQNSILTYRIEDYKTTSNNDLILQKNVKRL